MNPEKLILTPFERALSSLEEILELPKDTVVRDATIKRFEYTYELAWKMIRRHLKWTGEANADGLNRKDLFREAERIGLISNAEAWFDYTSARNETSHTYDEMKADEVYEEIKVFATDARKLLNELKKHHD
jgi:nucleotidyltransferase substrate binding protein (TIGR01987 family)